MNILLNNGEDRLTNADYLIEALENTVGADELSNNLVVINIDNVRQKRSGNYRTYRTVLPLRINGKYYDFEHGHNNQDWFDAPRIITDRFADSAEERDEAEQNYQLAFERLVDYRADEILEQILNQ